MARVKLELPAQLPWSTELRVRVTDINYGGHLGNDALLGLIHEARARFMSAQGYSELDVEGLGIIIADAVLVYRSEAFFGETLRIHIGADDYNRYGCDLFYRVESADEPPREVARVKTGLVFFDYASRRPASMPEAFRARLQALESDNNGV
ncbi:thioesterase family protein [Alkalilimnicola sp. S0819]|uniref:thioesterase family protein n=1 Tax=Alkalilimnicola sp. S0819 TaxID=2613922 RepID=UPI0012626FF0|nr:thioesterase family protein [Alkalilimnicola sp. S0819]KAB7627500.1 thioesterase [Alkalilimnicola sp. S0819]MPQ15654.1 thioesterase [Alkalilimnicola sp. S0819]